MQLVDQGRLSLDQDMRDVVPELETAKILRGFDASDQPIIEKNTRPITLKYVLLSSRPDPLLTFSTLIILRTFTC